MMSSLATSSPFGVDLGVLIDAGLAVEL